MDIDIRSGKKDWGFLCFALRVWKHERACSRMPHGEKEQALTDTQCYSLLMTLRSIAAMSVTLTRAASQDFPTRIYIYKYIYLLGHIKSVNLFAIQ